MNHANRIPSFRLLLAFAAGAPALQAEDTTAVSASTGDDVIQLEELTVTGEKLGRTTQETQLSVTGLSGSEIERTTDVDLADIFRRAANVYANAEGFSIRGIPNTGFTFTEGSDMATVLVDGATVDSQMFGYDGVSLWDVAQVEILRGPQSTTQGRNSMAGAVVARTKDPAFTFGGAARATFGEYSTRQLAFAGGGPVVPGVLAFRLSVDDHYSDGALSNVTRDEKDWDRTDTRTLRAKLLLQPAKWDGFSALLTYAQTDSRNGMRAYAYGETLDDLYERIAVENTRNEFDSRTRLASLEINQEFGNGWQLTSITSWSDFINSSAYDSDRTATDDVVYSFGYDNEHLSQEVRLLAKGESWRLLSGLYHASPERRVFSRGPFSYLIPPPLDAVFGLPTPSFALLSVDMDQLSRIENTALFLNGDWTPMEKWTVSVGARLDREKLDRSSQQQINVVQGFPDAVALVDVPSLGIVAGTPADLVIQGLAADASAAGDGTTSFNTVLPSAGITYHWTRDISTGITFTRGYRSGGAGLNQRRATIVPYDPEYTDNYEASFRSQWAGGKVTLNANVFYVDWKDQQVTVQLSGDIYDQQVENAGKSSYYGFETDLRVRLGRKWSVYQTIGHTRSRFDEFESSAGDYSGNEFPNCPPWTLGGGIAWQPRAGWFGTVSVNYVDGAFNHADNDPHYRIPSRAIVNTKVGYSAEHWTVYAYATNLFDEGYLENLWAQTTALYGAQIGAPRILGAGIDFRF